MPKRDKLYIGMMVLLAILYMVFEIFGPEPTDWSDSYSRQHTIPYGTYIVAEELGQIFPDQRIRNQVVAPFEFLRSTEIDTTERRNWVFINNRVPLDENEMALLMDDVSRGNHVFISATDPGNSVASELGFDLRVRTAFEEADTADLSTEDVSFSTTLNFEHPDLQRAGGWEYREGVNSVFTSVDTVRTQHLGVANSGFSNFIRVRHGDGAFYIHLFPKAFTNYYLREVGYAQYAFRALSYLPVEDVIWDEYYKAGRQTYATPLGYLLSVPPLRNAWYMLLGSLLLFMIFKGRRLQRPVPETTPPTNSTLEFARTIGHLYLEKGTHKEIAMKKIRFFTDYCRKNLGITIEDTSDETDREIADRSGVPQKEVSDMLNIIKKVQNASEIDKKTLKDLTTNIDQFYKKSQR